MDAPRLVSLALSAFAAGGMNALAGGGTILTFPALLLAGEPAIRANATSTVALLPAALASLYGYRREVATHRGWLAVLVWPSLAGGAAGSILLLATPERLFARLAPWLVLFATLLFGLQLRRGGNRSASASAPEPPAPRRSLGAVAAQFAVAVYGGYFGAGIGILMLALLAGLGLSNIHAMNGLKNFFGFLINVVAAVYFLARGAVDLPVAGFMLLAAAAGGYAGARFGRAIGQKGARIAVVAIGILVAALLFLAPS